MRHLLSAPPKSTRSTIFRWFLFLPLLTFTASVFAAAPSAPGSLRYEVYSSTAAEIFWNRSTDDGAVVGYEVQFNDEIVESRDALSYFTDSLLAGQTYDVSVVAIDDEGDRSEPATLSFIGGDTSTPGSLPPAGDVAAPTGLTASVYSSGSGELMWDRADEFGLTYEVSRNGSVVTTTDGVSYYDDSLEQDTEYNYEVVAIDLSGQRSLPATISLQTQSGGGSGPGTTPPAGDVAAPTGLTASVYSSGSGELMWDRADEFGLTYEVSRNGSLVATTDGVSYYDDTLEQGTVYNYEVVAIDLSGLRSAPAAISLQTQSGGGSGPGTTPPAGDVAAPTGLIASVYSSGSGEIMWDRPDSVGLTYEVSRNGSVVATTDGVSYYDDELNPDTLYTYEVVAIDLQGERSAASAIMLNTPPSGGAVPPIAGGEDFPGPTIAPSADDPNIAEPTDLYLRDGYSPVKVMRVDIRTATMPGPCNADDESGCTLADVIADVDKTDDHTVDIAIHFQSEDFPDDGTVSNAELRLRGGGSRFAPQKSFRVKLDSKEVLWRGERHLQLNKHPFESSRIRNKLAMDVMSEIPNLPSLRTQFVNLWIDDGEGPVDYGLFTHVERLNEYYLEKREFDDTSNIYKAENFRFDLTDLEDIRVDENGEPLDEDRFETTLEIENGEDHRILVDMVTAINDPDRSFESVLDQYFYRPNVMAWVAANFLLHQADSVRHNYLLYNPTGTEKFYFLPWDYDAAMGLWREPPNDLSNDSLRQRVEYGYAVASRNVFLEKYYRQPGIHEQIVDAVDSLRENYVTDEGMTAKVNAYINLSAPFQQREPDSINNSEFTVYSANKLISAPGENAEAVRSRFGVLMAPVLEEPELVDSEWRFSWLPAHDVTGVAGTITYELQIATSPNFNSGEIVVSVDDIEDISDPVVQNVDAGLLPVGQYFVRLIATPTNEPERYWQVSGNKLWFENETYYGPRRFEVE